MSAFEASAALCPFYQRESTNRVDIVCEGITDGCQIHLKFQGKKNAKKHLEQYCYGDYNRCSICKMLYGKYETSSE